MAQFIPTLEKIQQFKVRPTEGEWALLQFLNQSLDDSFEVYFNPFLNGDRPDVVLMRKGSGIMIIEVKDWDLNSYYIDERKHWHLTHPRNEREARAYIKSPIDQSLQYKNNLYNLHVENLLEMNIKNSNMWGVVVCGVYFHCATHKQVEEKIIFPFSDDKGYQYFIKHIALFGNDDLNNHYLKNILKRFHIISHYPSKYFSDELYLRIKHLLLPPLHTKNQGILISRYNGYLKRKNPTIRMYSKKQDELIFDEKKRKEWRVKGVVGSGKTTLMAAKAVQSYKELLEAGIEDPKILILTFNITLKNFIHDKMQQLHEDFKWSSFTILNYHQFIKSQLNNLGIDFRREENEDENSFYVRYFDNYNLFVDFKDKTERFDVIFIDEIQDYKRVWMDIIKDMFLIREGMYPRGGYYLLGDVKQNIYNRGIEGKDVKTNVLGANTLDTCFRSHMKIKDLALGFQQQFFIGKYEIDEDLTSDEDSIFFGQNIKQGYMNYMYLQSNNPIKTVFKIIYGNFENKINNVAINDIAVLGAEIEFLQLFDTYFRFKTGLKTSTMFETYEQMFLYGIREKSKIKPESLRNSLINLFKKAKDIPPYKTEIQMATLLASYEMYSKFPEEFETRLRIKCNDYKISFEDFLYQIQCFEYDYNTLRNEVFSSDYKHIRDNKKYNFWMNTGNIKISSVHSFKGWESDTIFLLLQKHYSGDPTFNELIYTGITRARSNLIILNLGNEEYDNNIRSLIETYK